MIGLSNHKIKVGIYFLTMFVLSACYHKPQAASTVNSQQSTLNSYYTIGYNFLVKSDTLLLTRQIPEELLSGMQTDTLFVTKGNHLVVAEIRQLPTDSLDSVWVQVANEEAVFGWVGETTLLKNVVPDDPISQFISTFSDVHTLIFLIVISLIVAVYIVRKISKHNAPLVHFRDIDSFYPTLLALLVASSATLYSSIQLFAPDTWQYFYYHPTLNPFHVPLVLSIFLGSVWAMLIVGIAVIDEVRHYLPFGDAILYLCGLVGVCAVDYIIFSITTLYGIGYILLVAYFYFAITRYFRQPHH